MKNITCEAEEAARNQHMKTPLYGLIEILCNEKPKESPAVLDKSENLLNKKEAQVRWTERLKKGLNKGEPENLNRGAPENPFFSD